MQWTTSKNGNPTGTNRGHRCTIFACTPGYAFGISVINSHDKPVYSRMYRTQKEARSAADNAMEDPANFETGFLWRISKKNNLYLIFGDVLTTVFKNRISGRYSYVSGGTFSPVNYKTEAEAMKAAESNIFDRNNVPPDDDDDLLIDSLPYQVLGVSVSATWDEIKSQWRKLVLMFHPDNQRTGNADRFREIQGAYETLEAIVAH